MVKRQNTIVPNKFKRRGAHGNPWGEEEWDQLIRWRHYPISELADAFERPEANIRAALNGINQTYSKSIPIKKKTIIDEVNNRNIKKLVHITDIRNAANIDKYGLLLIQELNEKRIKYYKNDLKRFDPVPNGICTSISNVNPWLVRSYESKKSHKNIQWVVIEISPSILADHQCQFFDTNAANGKFRNSRSLSTLSDFEHMFSETIINKSGPKEREYRQKINEPTCDQAEIIFEQSIARNKILGIKDHNHGKYLFQDQYRDYDSF